MKKMVAVLLLFCYCEGVKTQQLYKWKAETGGWQDPENWEPARYLPHTTDLLLFEDSSVISGLPASEEVYSLEFGENCHITFESPAPSYLTATTKSTALLCHAGARVIFSGSGGLVWRLSGDGRIHGDITFKSGPQRILPESTARLTFETGANFYAAAGFTGNPFGTNGVENVIFQDGAVYVSIAGANPFGASAPASVVVFERGSVYRHQRSTAPQLSGRTYGHFEIVGSSSYNLALSADFTIQNNLIISNGQFLFRPSGGVGNLRIGGDIVHSGGGTLQLGQSSWPGEIILTGAASHSISAEDITAPFELSRLSVQEGNLNLYHPIEVSESVALQNAVLMTSDSALLFVKAHCRFVFPASSYPLIPYPFTGYHAGYIDGPMVWRGLQPESSYVFPVGKMGQCRPVIVHKATGDVYVQYFNKNPENLSPLLLNDSILQLKHDEYWKIDGLAGNALIELSFETLNNWSFPLSYLRVCRFQHSGWESVGNTATVGEYTLHGSVSSEKTGNGYFTLGTSSLSATLSVVDPSGQNPGGFQNSNLLEDRNSNPSDVLLVYPNPVSEKIFIFFKHSSSKSQIDIVSIKGNVVQRAEFYGEKGIVNVTKLPSGIYFLQFRNRNLNRTQIFVKQ